MSTNYKLLKKEWYQKLKDSGFVDVEEANGRFTKGLPRLDKLTYGQYQYKVEFYNQCRNFLTFYPFETEIERFIWEQFTEGLSYRDISIKLESVFNVKKKKDTVGKIIKHFKQLMIELKYHE